MSVLAAFTFVVIYGRFCLLQKAKQKVNYQFGFHFYVERLKVVMYTKWGIYLPVPNNSLTEV